VISHFEAALLTHGLDLADDLVYEAFLYQFRCQVGIQHNGHLIVLLRYIAFLLCHVDQQIVLGQFHSHTVYIEL
jgi:hypothetical protein